MSGSPIHGSGQPHVHQTATTSQTSHVQQPKTGQTQAGNSVTTNPKITGTQRAKQTGMQVLAKGVRERNVGSIKSGLMRAYQELKPGDTQQREKLLKVASAISKLPDKDGSYVSLKKAAIAVKGQINAAVAKENKSNVPDWIVETGDPELVELYKNLEERDPVSGRMDDNKASETKIQKSCERLESACEQVKSGSKEERNKLLHIAKKVVESEDPKNELQPLKEVAGKVVAELELQGLMDTVSSQPDPVVPSGVAITNGGLVVLPKSPDSPLTVAKRLGADYERVKNGTQEEKQQVIDQAKIILSKEGSGKDVDKLKEFALAVMTQLIGLPPDPDLGAPPEVPPRSDAPEFSGGLDTNLDLGIEQQAGAQHSDAIKSDGGIKNEGGERSTVINDLVGSLKSNSKLRVSQDGQFTVSTRSRSKRLFTRTGKKPESRTAVSKLIQAISSNIKSDIYSTVQLMMKLDKNAWFAGVLEQNSDLKILYDEQVAAVSEFKETMQTYENFVNTLKKSKDETYRRIGVQLEKSGAGQIEAAWNLETGKEMDREVQQKLEDIKTGKKATLAEKNQATAAVCTERGVATLQSYDKSIETVNKLLTDNGKGELASKNYHETIHDPYTQLTELEGVLRKWRQFASATEQTEIQQEISGLIGRLGERRRLLMDEHGIEIKISTSSF